MKLFDYKFLILLGLTLVVYFMFREIIDLRKKINTLEQSVDNINKKMITNTLNKVLSNQSEEKSIFQIPLPGPIQGTGSGTLLRQNQETNSGSNIEIVLGKPIFQIPLPTINEDPRVYEIDSDDEEVSITGENVAIYSNDNEEDVIDNYSLDDSSDIETPDDNKKNTLLTNTDECNDDQIVVSSEITILDTLNFETCEIEYVDHANNDNTSIIHTDTHTVHDLMKRKLSELQCIAESLSIELINNGKKKTKSDLSNEIVNHNCANTNNN